MRIAVNLASEPFRRDRGMVVGSAVLCAVLVLMLFGLASIAYAERQRASASREAMLRTERQVASMTNEENRLTARLRQAGNAEVFDRSVFLNALLLRKGVSWTLIFSDLEAVTPHDVRLITVRPQINARNELLLDMVVGATSAQPVLNFVMKLETAPVFGATTVHNWLPPSQTEPLYRYRVSVSYDQKL